MVQHGEKYSFSPCFRFNPMSLDPLDEERIQRIREELTQKFQEPIPDSLIHQAMPGVLYRRSGLIHLTKLNGTPFMMNAELIETVEATPDTVITLVTGRKYIVREPVDQVREKCIAYKREIGMPLQP